MHENADEVDETLALVGAAAPALDAVQREPRTAEELARELLAREDLAIGERAGALWALGRAQSELDRPGDAIATLADAISHAEHGGLDALGAEIRVSRSVCLLTAGEADAARSELERAEPSLSGAPLGRLFMQRALLDLHAGRLTSALAGFDAALPRLRAGGDRLAICRLLANRGVVLSYLGDNRRAEADLVACQELAIELDQHLVAAGATHNLGYLRGRSGDIPGALEWFARARGAYEELGMPARLATSLETDLCGVLLAGGLHREAVAAAERAERAAAEGGNQLALAEARLLHAQALLAQGSADAEALALEAAAAFRAAERLPYAAYADHVALQAAATGDTSSSELLERAITLVEPLEEQGWRAEAVEVATVAGRLALAAGDVDTARLMLGRAARDRGRGTAAVRADGWLATAHLRLVQGDRGGARRALGAGLRIVEAHRASLGATELRTRATRHATDLAALGLEMSVDDQRAAELLVWAERWHAGAMSLAPIRPPRDGAVAGLLDDLRAAHSALRDTTLAGEPSQAEAAAVARLELSVRDASRMSMGGRAAARPRTDPRLLRDHLAMSGATLVEYVVVRGDLWAVRVTGRRCVAVQLGALPEVANAIAQVLASLRRLALGRSSARSLEAAVASLAHAGEGLSRLLVEPLGLPPSGPLVVVPTAVLQSLPWSVLPPLTDRAVTVAPSAWVWQRGPAAGGSVRSTSVSTPPVDTSGRGAAGPKVALIAGPDLPHAPREVRAVASIYDRPVVLRDPDSTARRVLDAMEGSQIVHLAAHGHFRADSPFFTSLQLSDGPLTVYDLEHLVDAPDTVILPACDAGMAEVRTGDELVGTAAALVSVGVSSVVAPLTVVPDDAVVAMMVDLHRALVEGARPSVALCRARAAAVARSSPGDLAAAHAFVAVGTHRT